MEDSLFSLLRLGLGVEEPSKEALQYISKLSADQWTNLRTLTEKQGVAAIAFDGVNRLIDSFGQESIIKNIDSAWWKVFILEWMGQLLMIEQSNQRQITVMNDLAQKWATNGCRVMVMKGQSNGLYYPKPEHRNTGDIDCYLFEDYSTGNNIAQYVGAKVDKSWYKHSVISYKGETFENHQFFVHTRDGKGGKQLEKELEEALKVESKYYTPLSKYVVSPPVQWTAMFLTYHACAHFISEGLNLKQILDWAMFLHKNQNKVDWPQFYEFCSKHHLNRFAVVATAIAKEYLGIKINNETIKSESQYTERVLHSALYDDDYVFGSGKGNWYNRFHLIKNLWTYRWKYRDIYEMSPLRQLWYYASGFIFKTE